MLMPFMFLRIFLFFYWYLFLTVNFTLISYLLSFLLCWQAKLLKGPYPRHLLVLPYTILSTEELYSLQRWRHSHFQTVKAPLNSNRKACPLVSFINCFPAHQWSFWWGVLTAFNAQASLSWFPHFSPNTVQWQLLGFCCKWIWEQSNSQEMRPKRKNKVLSVIQL